MIIGGGGGGIVLIFIFFGFITEYLKAVLLLPWYVVQLWL